MILYLIIFLFIITDLYFRTRNMKKTSLRAFETLCVLVILVASIIVTKNIKYISVAATAVIGSAIILKSFYNNLFATIYLFFIPSFETDDVITLDIDDYSKRIESGDQAKNFKNSLIFKKLGWLRSPMTSINGDIILVPNSILLNDTIVMN